MKKTENSIEQLNTIIQKARAKLLEMHYRAKCGHIGGNLSCLEALLTLHHSVMTRKDQFILSKGHSAGALYVALWSLKKLSDADLETFCKDDTLLPGHPSGSGIPDLLFATGSLGHGPSLAAGLALAARQKNSQRHIYCLCSDGEWQEGSCWEALIFSIHQRLDNLTILIDQNRLQGFGRTEEVISCDDLAPRIAAFGATVVTVDGHNPIEIIKGLKAHTPLKPHIVLLNTTKGRGLDYENKLESHYLPLSDGEYASICTRMDQ